MKPRTLAVFAAFAALASAHSHAQATRAPAQRISPSYESTATAVLVDVVVRDKRGRPVTDLVAEEFEIREDDVRQPLGSFTRVSRGGGIGVNLRVKDPNAPTIVSSHESELDSESAPTATNPAVTALVFDALSPDAIAMCQKAAFHYLPMSGSTGARIGVFTTEPTVHALQAYTDDPARVRQAVRRLQPTNTIAKETQQERIDALRDRREHLEELTGATESALSAGGGSFGQSGAAANLGQLEMERRLVRSQLQMVQAFDTLDRDHRGFNTTSALFAVIQSLVEMPGRKTLVFFSEGLPASPALQTQLRSVIEAANRSNISVYAIDATGLRAVSSTQDVRKEVEEAGKERLRQLSTLEQVSDEPQMRMIERTEDLLRLDSQSGLARLAEDTGGFLVRDTNDLTQAFRRIDEDMRFHYLLTYAPLNQAFDGKFRAITVKVTRPGVDVYARKGYRALPLVPPGAPASANASARATPTATAGAMPVLDYEAAGIAALDAPRVPHAFAFTTSVFSFPEPGRPGLSPLIVRLTTDAVTYARDAANNSYLGEADIIVRFKNSAGDVVHKVSQQYHLTGRLDELDAALQGEILFYRQPDFPPGVYTVEAVIYDVVGARASAKVSTLEIPKPAPDRARLSSVMLVRKAEPARSDMRPAAARQGETRDTETRQIDNPLYVGDLLLYPNAGEPISRAHDRELTFYYTVYPHPRRDQPTPKRPEHALTAEINLRRNGHTIARVPVALGAADTQGRIQQLSRLPLQPLPNGTYELSIVIHDDARSVERSTFFTVTN